MAVRTLEKSERHGHFDRVSRVLLGKRAEIEVASSNLATRSKPSGCLFSVSLMTRKTMFRKLSFSVLII
jgi:hypothetical protein